MAKDSPETPTNVVDEIRSKLREIAHAQTTCHGEDCSKLDALSAQLKTIEAAIPEKVKAAMDSRTAVFDERLKGIEATVSAIKVPVPNPVPPAPVEVEVPEDRVFQCPKCGDALVIGQPECPNETCEEVIDWTGILAPAYLREVEKQLEGGE
jgi:hypothetical protein